MSVSIDRAYRLIRESVDAKVITRANAPQKGNLKAYLPADRPRFVPDPADILARIPQIATPVEFIHPLTGKKITLRRTKKQNTGTRGKRARG
jgi:hypothetical protein